MATETERKDIYGVIERNGKSWWTKIGAAFPNRDGSYNQVFDYLPTSATTTIQMREPKPREDSEAPQE